MHVHELNPVEILYSGNLESLYKEAQRVQIAVKVVVVIAVVVVIVVVVLILIIVSIKNVVKIQRRKPTTRPDVGITKCDKA